MKDQDKADIINALKDEIAELRKEIEEARQSQSCFHYEYHGCHCNHHCQHNPWIWYQGSTITSGTTVNTHPYGTYQLSAGGSS
jgi:hypothetical protein